MSTMALVGEAVHYDHGSGQKCTALLIHNVDNPGTDGMTVDGAEILLNLGVIVTSARNNVANDPACSNGTWHYKGDCIR